MLGHVPVRARDEHSVVRIERTRGPHLLAVDDPLIAGAYPAGLSRLVGLRVRRALGHAPLLHLGRSDDADLVVTSLRRAAWGAPREQGELLWPTRRSAGLASRSVQCVWAR